MAAFQSVREEFLATQQAAEMLLNELSSGKEVTESVLDRLDKLSIACANLCYSNDLLSDISDNIENLIKWCDHLDDPKLKEEFIGALKESPLRSPW